MFTTRTTVLNKLVECYNVPEALGNPVKVQERTIIAPNGFLTEAFDECDKAHIQTVIAFTDELGCEQVRTSQRS